MPPTSAPSPCGARRTPSWARRWGKNVQWSMKAWSGKTRRGDLPMAIYGALGFQLTYQVFLFWGIFVFHLGYMLHVLLCSCWAYNALWLKALTAAYTWALFQYKKRLSRYEDFHYKDKTVVRPSYLYNGNSYAGRTASLCWDSHWTSAPLLSSTQPPVPKVLHIGKH